MAVIIRVPGSELGDATAEDVVAGKTFTSTNGLKLIGTLAGGGLPNNISVLASGTVTPTEDTAYLNISHGLGVAPNFLVWWLEADTSNSVLTSIATDGATIVKSAKYTSTSATVYNIHNSWHGYTSSSQFNKGEASIYSNATDMTASIARMRASSTYYIKSGYTYRWVCGVVDGIA